MNKLIRIATLSAIALVTSLLIALIIAPPAGATTAASGTAYMIDYSSDITCPTSHPIKGQTSNAATGVTTFQC